MGKTDNQIYFLLIEKILKMISLHQSTIWSVGAQCSMIIQYATGTYSVYSTKVLTLSVGVYDETVANN